MSNVHRIFGAENSPFSVKVRSYFRYKGIEHEWLGRSGELMAEYQKYAKLPLIPLVVCPDDEALQDSTPIIETMESRFPEPALQPADQSLAFLSSLLEEFGDEWGNKWMLHYRWARPADQQAASMRLVGEMAPELEGDKKAGMAKALSDRMIGRVSFVGSNEVTADQIEQSWKDALPLLDAHLADRPYVFGGRPALADFGLWGQVYNCSLDPTPGGLLRDGAPNVVAWVERMLDPKAEGKFETWQTLAATLQPLLKQQVGGLFLPWSEANRKAFESGAEEYSVELAGRTWTQTPIKYQVRSLAEIRKKYAALGDNAALASILDDCGCLEWLKPA